MSVAIRLTRAWKYWSIGSVIPEMPENLAASLVGKGTAEYVAADLRSQIEPHKEKTFTRVLQRKA